MTIDLAVLTEGPDGPSARHRWGYPARHLAEEGIRVRLLPVEPREARPESFRAAAEANLVVVHRKLFRLPDLVRLRREIRRGFVFDLDDAVMYRPSGRRRQWSLMRSLRFARTMRQSLLFLPGNAYLESRAPRRVPTLIRPTPIEVSRHEPRDSWPEAGRVIGWIGTRATMPYLAAAGPALAELSRTRGDLVLRVIGPEAAAIDGVRVEHVRWTEDGEAAAIREIDVGILPLPDDPWTRGKCSFKALQYMASGVPVVASPVGMNRDVVRDGETGFLAADAGEWTARLDLLLGDRGLREAMGRAGRRRAEEVYSNEVLTPALAAAIRGLAR